jgi:hypothetical protein
MNTTMHFFCWYRRENDSLFLSQLGRVELGAGGAVRETLAPGVDGLASELLVIELDVLDAEELVVL